ncbi:hypothetical protein TNCV_3993021 [Trichonephila clavipes]|uniref:Uncharacterized protein n=1 Tax=Trichonephila clavipes TaxID=2585209 RepID=A0A8X6T8A6_TRICX|nr:hypothetical protein TNCV_3993021 [Trichonephila clavipes]
MMKILTDCCFTQRCAGCQKQYHSSTTTCLLTPWQHLENLRSDFKERLQDILNMDIPEWVLDPVSNVNTAESG